MKTVQSGAHYTTVTVDTAEAVKFSFPSTSLSVEASGGDITVALTDTAQAGDDETITVPDGESRMFIHHRMNIDTYYLTGSGTAKLYASNMGDVNPFKGKGKGGDGGGDNTHYKGTTTTPLTNGSTTNPIIIDGESYTAVFGDVVVYGYTEFVFDGTAWAEFGRPFDTTPIKGSTNAVTSDGIYQRTPLTRYGSSMHGGYKTSVAFNQCFAYGVECMAAASRTVAFGDNTKATQDDMVAIGKFNSPNSGDIFNIGNGSSNNARSNILEVSDTDMNVNGDIKINNVSIPTPYTTMPAITADMLGKIAMYVGASDSNYKQGCFYVASTDGAAEPTYSWVKIGGGRTETVLWENDGTTNPDTITLSEAWSNFDELAIITDFQGAHYINTNIKLTSHFIVGEKAVFWYYDDNVAADYTVTSSTTFTLADASGQYFLYKIIGIKY